MWFVFSVVNDLEVVVTLDHFNKEQITSNNLFAGILYSVMNKPRNEFI